MNDAGLDPIVLATIVAVGIGLLVGTERERSKGSGPEPEIAGVRTFTVVSLLGLFATLLAHPVAFAALALAVGVITIVGYFKSRASDPGITTEVALLATFALGALSLPHPAYSAAAGVILTVILAARPWLHDAVKSRLTDRELHDGLLLLAAALVILPLLPNRTIDAWNVINPRSLWLVVVLVMTLNGAAYVALRVLGPRKGLMLAGVLGGFVSSVSTHGALGQRASAQPTLAPSAAAAANLSSVATVVLMFIVVGAVQLSLAQSMLLPLAAAGAVSGLYGLLLLRRHNGAGAEMQLGRPLSPRAALTFGAVLGVVILGTAMLQKLLGSGGALAGIAIGGLADAHSAGISAAVLHRGAVLDQPTAELAILLAFTTNALVKVIVSGSTGPRGFWMHIVASIAMSVGAAWLVWLLLR